MFHPVYIVKTYSYLQNSVYFYVNVPYYALQKCTYSRNVAVYLVAFNKGHMKFIIYKYGPTLSIYSFQSCG